MNPTTASVTIAADRVAETQPARGELSDRVALVTGGSRGIGAAICLSLAAKGAAIAAGYSRNHEKALAISQAIEGCGVAASIHRGNVGHADDCRRVVSEVLERHGRLDILVNNAGITSDRPALKMIDDEWQQVVAVNLSGAFYLSQAALPHMLERGSGRIVNISSVIGQQGNIGQVNYAASKAGLFGLTTTLAREAAHAYLRDERHGPNCPGVTVNAVAPGFIETEMLQTVPEKVLDRIRGRIPAGRLGRPEEVAHVVAFLCLDESAYITGQIWSVNGGLEMAGA
jgi:NAD(P)-dependent dehydrogenase (short-subunit alcohol dehydrogenase family)